MTFSIVTRDPAAGGPGFAIASMALAVGAVAPFALANAGDISTQVAPNVVYPQAASRAKPSGPVAGSVLATFTGATCLDSAGGKSADAPGPAMASSSPSSAAEGSTSDDGGG